MSRPTEAAKEIVEALLEKIPVDDRVEFLFGIVIGMLRLQGLNETEVRAKLLEQLNAAYAMKDSVS